MGAEEAPCDPLPSATGDPTDEVRGSGPAARGVRAHSLPPRKRGFRRYVDRYEDEGLDGLADKRLGQVSARRAPVDEVVRIKTLSREHYEGRNVRHFYRFYRREHQGTRSYTWVKNALQGAGLVTKAPGRGWTYPGLVDG